MQDRKKGAKCITFHNLFSANLTICPASSEALQFQFRFARIEKVLANLCKDSIRKSPNLFWSNPRWARSFVAERFWCLSTKKLDTPKEKNQRK